MATGRIIFRIHMATVGLLGNMALFNLAFDSTEASWLFIGSLASARVARDALLHLLFAPAAPFRSL